MPDPAIPSPRSNPLSDAVAAQYERWAYPEPASDLSHVARSNPAGPIRHLRDLYWKYWPSSPFRDNLHILVAGCGTVLAAAYAQEYPHAQVVGIDISAASLASQQRLKERHNLSNLALHRCPIEEMQSLGQSFDFISASGVLHHLADPVAGLLALGNVLREDGVIDIMVYGKYGRGTVCMFQDLFRMLGLQQEQADVEIVKEALASLQDDHPLRPYLSRATDLDFDCGLIDTFLHPRERAYTVGDCLALVSQAGLAFAGWQDNWLYYGEGVRGENFRKKIDALHGPDLWAAMELFRGGLVNHRFHACKPQRDPQNYRIQFDDEEFLDYVPVRNPAVILTPGAAGCIRIAMENNFTANLTSEQSSVFKAIDSARTVRQCLAMAQLNPATPQYIAFARDFFGALWRISYVIFRKV